MKTIIIDDEELARSIIKSYLKNYPEFEVIDECENGFTGIKSIQENKPDLVFLDIQMPKLSGLEMLELIDEKPIIIFATAFDEFAVKAFDMNAIDYLLKPFSKDRFSVAIEKAVEKFHSGSTFNNNSALNNLIDQVKESHPADVQRIVVKKGAKIQVIPADQIFYIEAQDDYVMIYTKDDKFLKKERMKFYEEHLDTKQFIRIHRSYIVNINFISGLELFEKDSYLVILKNGTNLKTSKSGYKNLKEIFDF